ncbi:MAG: hypothetical protein Kow0080_28060 [Candidatus Promineifilaceae bacterium]
MTFVQTVPYLYERRPLPEMQQRAQAFLHLMQGRHSIRDFADKPVPLDVVQACLPTTGRAPSGANQQPWHFVVVTDTAVVSARGEDGGAGDPLTDSGAAYVFIGVPTNQPPTANAGPDQNVEIGTAVTLDGSGSSDPDGNTPLTYGWTQTGGAAVTLHLKNGALGDGGLAANGEIVDPGGPAESAGSTYTLFLPIIQR